MKSVNRRRSKIKQGINSVSLMRDNSRSLGMVMYQYIVNVNKTKKVDSWEICRKICNMNIKTSLN